MLVRCANDDGFGPVLTQGLDCYGFDFTLVFEDYILSIAPCGIALLLAAARIFLLAKRDAVVRWPQLRAIKLVRLLSLVYSAPWQAGRCVVIVGVLLTSF